MRVLVVDQCSASKAVEVDEQRTTLDDQEAADAPTGNGERVEARELYTGKQQRRVGNAVRTLRKHGHDVDRHFVSAGFGVVSETERLPPYDETFSTMSVDEIRERSRELSITDDLVDVAADDVYDLVFLPLGSDYYRAIDLDRVLRVLEGTTVVLFNRETDEDRREHVISIPARTDQARENGSTVVGLKGTYLERFANRLGAASEPPDPERLRSILGEPEDADTTFDDF